MFFHFSFYRLTNVGDLYALSLFDPACVSFLALDAENEEKSIRSEDKNKTNVNVNCPAESQYKHPVSLLRVYLWSLLHKRGWGNVTEYLSESFALLTIMDVLNSMMTHLNHDERSSQVLFRMADIGERKYSMHFI